MTIQNTIGDFLHEMIVRLANALPAFKLSQEFGNLPALFGGHRLDFVHDLRCRHHFILHEIRDWTSRSLDTASAPYFAAGG